MTRERAEKRQINDGRGGLMFGEGRGQNEKRRAIEEIRRRKERKWKS